MLLPPRYDIEMMMFCHAVLSLQRQMMPPLPVIDAESQQRVLASKGIVHVAQRRCGAMKEA